LLLTREMLGKELNLLLLRYHMHMLASLLALAVVLLRRPTAD
jgi:hypothetical protein